MQSTTNFSKLKKWALILLGVISLILGVVGILIPLLPTTPFLLLSAWSFLRSSKKMHVWLLNHPWVGKYIRDFQEHKAITLRTKIVSVAFLWITITFSSIFVVNSPYIKWLLGGIAIGVTVHILHYQTLQDYR